MTASRSTADPPARPPGVRRSSLIGRLAAAVCALVAAAIAKLPGAVAIEVSDRGTGMTEAVLSHALLPFYSTKRGGTGLGLALVREIAEAHGGRVALANRPDGGVSVTITLPQ